MNGLNSNNCTDQSHIFYSPTKPGNLSLSYNSKNDKDTTHQIIYITAIYEQQYNSLNIMIIPSVGMLKSCLFITLKVHGTKLVFDLKEKCIFISS